VSRVTALATNRVYVIGFVVEVGLSMLFPLQFDSPHDAVEEGKER
jgi:hypothetical protein